MTVLNISESEIAKRCFDPNREIVGGLLHGNLVVKLSEEIVVKFGWGVTIEEADNQRKAYKLLDRNIVHVPQVYRYFTQSVEGYPARGFVVMEYFHGNIINLPNSSQIDQIAQIISYIASIRGQRPGPLQKGVSRGLLWQDSGEPVFESTQQMEWWLNVRLPDIETKLALQNYPLVFCHLDLAPQNILWLDNGSICLLDWASAEFYPRLFEVGLLKIMEYTHADYEVTLKERMEPLTDDEEAQVSLLVRSFYNGIKYSFVSF
jgi:serine/threonine protein kinase